MKKYIITTVACCLFIISYSNAQHNLTGPRAKNRKQWDSTKKETVTMLKKHSHKPLTGPKAKNHKPWKDDCLSEPIVFRERNIVKGHRAKSTRPELGNYWIKKDRE
jgi:hypothetical protein